MPPMFHSAIGYLQFNKLLETVEQAISEKRLSILGYSDESVHKRLLQRIVEISLNPFVVSASKFHAANPDKSIIDQNEIEVSGLHFSIISGNVKIKPALFIINVGQFFVHWGLVLIAHIASLNLFRKGDGRPATIVHGVGIECFPEDGEDIEFLRYCAEGPIEPLKSASRLIVMRQKSMRSSNPDFVQYVRFPLLSLVRSRGMNLFELMRFVVSHVGSVFQYFRAITRYPLLVLLGKDFAYHEMILRLNRDGVIENIIITNSNYTAQPLWMYALKDRLFHTHFIWYSMNVVPFVYRHDGIKVDQPSLKFINADESWVWTSSFAGYLKDIGIGGKMHVVGPILWYLSNAGESFSSREMKCMPRAEKNVQNICRIVVFDVTPFQDKKVAELGLVHNYYSGSNMIMFIDQILAVGESVEEQLKLEIEIILKHKREYHPMHDRGYIELIHSYEKEGKICLADPKVNMYELVRQCDLAVVIPYSSPAYVAASVGIPSIYFDPGEEIIPQYGEDKFISFASGKQSLQSQIINLLSLSQ